MNTSEQRSNVQMYRPEGRVGPWKVTYNVYVAGVAVTRTAYEGFDRAEAERVEQACRQTLCECCGVRRASGRDTNKKAVCATCCPYGVLSAL